MSKTPVGPCMLEGAPEAPQAAAGSAGASQRSAPLVPWAAWRQLRQQLWQQLWHCQDPRAPWQARFLVQALHRCTNVG